MQFERFPRPAGDTGLGFHIGTGTPVGDPAAQAFWLDELAALGASWIVLPGTLDQPVALPFLRALIRQQIEPILRVDAWPIGPVDQSRLAALCRSYADAGAHYLHLYREPNLATQWRIDDWTGPGLVNRFGQLLLPALETIRNNGLIPLLSPLAPGGHYWDLTFLNQLLGFLTRYAKGGLLDDLGVCIHNYATNRPLTWGEGGAARWPNAHPYAAREAGEDHRGFGLFSWYDEVIRARLGRSLPLLCGETGLVLGTRDHLGFPRIDEDQHREGTLAIAELAYRRALPPYLFNVAFWTLAAGEDDPVDSHAWYRRDGGQIPTVAALKEWFAGAKARPEAEAAEPAESVEVAGEPVRSALVLEPAPTPSGERPIPHYILLELGKIEPREVSAYLGVLLPYAARFRATLGFRHEEARLADRVTAVGPDAGALIRIQRELQLLGCRVDLLHAVSATELASALGSVA